MPGTTEVLLRIEADASGLGLSVEQSKRYIEELQKAVKDGAMKMDASGRYVSTGVNRVGKEFQTAFGGRPRFMALSLLSSQLSGLTYDMAGATGGSRVLTGAFMGMQSGAMALGATMPYVLAGTVVLTGAMALLKYTTKEGSKEFEEYAKKIKEVKKEMEGLSVDEAKYAIKQKELNDLIAYRLALSKTESGYLQINRLHLDEQIKKLEESIGVYDDYMASKDRAIRQIQLEALLIKGETIPNLKTAIEAIEEEKKKLIESGKEKMTTVEYMKEINRLNKEGADLQDKLNDTIKKETDERKKATEEQIKYLMATTPMKTGLIEMPFGKKQTDKSLKDQLSFNKQLKSNQLKATDEFVEIWRADFDKRTKLTEDALAKQMTAVRHWTSQIGNAFGSSFMGINDAWQSMIQNMISELLSAGFESLILSIFAPGLTAKKGGIGGLFGEILGFQQGLPYAPRTMPVIVHEGERILTRQENKYYNYNSGGNAQTINVLNLDPEKLTKKSVIPVIEKERKYRRFK